jgi:RNA polymerase sigma factor (sigma-70 family)
VIESLEFETKVHLILKAQAGDLIAWQSLLTDLYPQALRQARALLRDRDLAEDAVQNTLIKLYTHLDSLVEPASFTAWWRRILTNEVYAILRLNQRESSQLLDEGIQQQSGLAIDEMVALRCELARALQRLPFDQQQVVLDIDLRGSSLQEVADCNHINLGTVKSRLFRAREKLQQELKVFRQGRKEKKAMSNEIGKRNLGELFYDYLEGTMDGGERARFEAELAEHPEWARELQHHKDFVTLLHTLTGKLTLTSADVLEKIQTVVDKIRDYEQIVDDTYYGPGSPQTITSHIWFHTPDLYRVESCHPLMGEMLVVVNGCEATTYMAKSKQAAKIAVSEEFREQMGFNFADLLKKMAADKSSRLLGCEYVSGRPALHLQFNQKVAGKGDMITHLWMEKETWMPLVTELYNADGELVQRKVVRELRLNIGLTDEYFTLSLPADVQLQDNSQKTLQPLQDITLEEAKAKFGEQPFILPAAEDSYQVKHQWITLPGGEGVLLTQYFALGEPVAKLTVSQGKCAHASLPANLSTVPVHFLFAGTDTEGQYVELGMKPVTGILVWNQAGRYYTLGGDFTREELIKLAGKLRVS